jgi:hypothetical protein
MTHLRLFRCTCGLRVSDDSGISTGAGSSRGANPPGEPALLRNRAPGQPPAAPAPARLPESPAPGPPQPPAGAPAGGGARPPPAPRPRQLRAGPRGRPPQSTAEAHPEPSPEPAGSSPSSRPSARSARCSAPPRFRGTGIHPGARSEGLRPESPLPAADRCSRSGSTGPPSARTDTAQQTPGPSVRCRVAPGEEARADILPHRLDEPDWHRRTRPQGSPREGDGIRALRRVLGQGRLDQVEESGRNLRYQHRQGRALLGRAGYPAGQGEPRYRAEGEDVGPGVEAFRLGRAGIQEPRRSGREPSPLTEAPPQFEVAQQRLALLGEEDVRGSDVTVGHPLPVEVGERLRDGHQYRHRLADRQRTPHGHQVLEGASGVRSP